MSRATSLALHRATCHDSDCPYCQNRAEERADPEPEVDYAGERVHEAYLDRLGDA